MRVKFWAKQYLRRFAKWETRERKTTPVDNTIKAWCDGIETPVYDVYQKKVFCFRFRGLICIDYDSMWELRGVTFPGERPAGSVIHVQYETTFDRSD